MRKTVGAINWLNKALLLFPNGTSVMNFLDLDVIRFLEWSLQAQWQEKFNLEGYIPTLHSKQCLINAYESIEDNKMIPKVDMTMN